MEHKILFLGETDSPLVKWLQSNNENVTQHSDILTQAFIETNHFTFLISFGYRHIIKKNILDTFPNRAINLHISYLPWNRGADPNFWSFLENTPKGVTIHYLDEGVDTGDIIVQKEIVFNSETETLSTSYAKLQFEIVELFKANWWHIKNECCSRIKQKDKGSFHKMKDKEPFLHLLAENWNTSVSILEDFGKHFFNFGTC